MTLPPPSPLPPLTGPEQALLTEWQARIRHCHNPRDRNWPQTLERLALPPAATHAGHRPVADIATDARTGSATPLQHWLRCTALAAAGCPPQQPITYQLALPLLHACDAPTPSDRTIMLAARNADKSADKDDWYIHADTPAAADSLLITLQRNDRTNWRIQTREAGRIGLQMQSPPGTRLHTLDNYGKVLATFEMQDLPHRLLLHQPLPSPRLLAARNMPDITGTTADNNTNDTMLAELDMQLTALQWRELQLLRGATPASPTNIFGLQASARTCWRMWRHLADAGRSWGDLEAADAARNEPQTAPAEHWLEVAGAAILENPAALLGLPLATHDAVAAHA